MKIIILALLLFSSSALSKEVDYDLIKSDLDLVSSAMVGIKESRKPAQNKARIKAVQSILEDLDVRLNSVKSSCGDIDYFRLLVKSFNTISSKQTVAVSPYYGSGICAASKMDACVTYIGKISKNLPDSDEFGPKYYSSAARACVGLNSNNEQYPIFLTDKNKKNIENLIQEYLVYIAKPEIKVSKEYEKIRVSAGSSGLIVEFGDHSASDGLDRLIKSLHDTIREEVFTKGQQFYFDLGKIALVARATNSLNTRLNNNAYLSDSVPCDLEYSLEEWNQFEKREKTFKTIRCHIDAVRNGINDTYKELREGDPDLSGKMVVEMVVNTRGQVNVQSIDSELPEVLSTVTTSVLETIQFPQMSDEDMPIQYTFTFIDDN